MEVRPLSADLEEVARRDLNEDPARLEGDLKHLREWLAKQPHLTARTGNTGPLLLAFTLVRCEIDSLCGLVVRVPGYRSRGPGSIPGTNIFSEK
jgi:hypothetical protein